MQSASVMLLADRSGKPVHSKTSSYVDDVVLIREQMLSCKYGPSTQYHKHYLRNKLSFIKCILMESITILYGINHTVIKFITKNCSAIIVLQSSHFLFHLLLFQCDKVTTNNKIKLDTSTHEFFHLYPPGAPRKL